MVTEVIRPRSGCKGPHGRVESGPLVALVDAMPRPPATISAAAVADDMTADDANSDGRIGRRRLHQRSAVSRPTSVRLHGLNRRLVDIDMVELRRRRLRLPIIPSVPTRLLKTTAVAIADPWSTESGVCRTRCSSKRNDPRRSDRGRIEPDVKNVPAEIALDVFGTEVAPKHRPHSAIARV